MSSTPIYHTTWWRHSLVREISLILIIKIMLIFLLWWAFFHVPAENRINTTQVSTHVVGSTSQPLPLAEETSK